MKDKTDGRGQLALQSEQAMEADMPFDSSNIYGAGAVGGSGSDVAGQSAISGQAGALGEVARNLRDEAGKLEHVLSDLLPRFRALVEEESRL